MCILKNIYKILFSTRTFYSAGCNKINNNNESKDIPDKFKNILEECTVEKET